ncbi:chemotaxis protein CheW [Geminocystis sp. NIES-3709]|uniref:chemotaxis protein CheW n=1 Tax=Geminocystis sp. NIES-3709 TaxID=1617448 RepID=UPI0005FC4000|nr:chemotaxis protein CheW [Geminocystis sp. NIES-3709]BAQ66864.1 CheW protein [Geminocystis sp. NIES-3709]
MSESSSVSSKLRELLPQLFEKTQIRGDRYLRFQLNSELTTLISIDYVTESLIIDRDKITPVPKMSPFVMGVINSRDRVFFVIDLPLLLDLTPIPSYARESHLIVINVASFLDNKSSELWLGLAIDKIQGITRTEKKPEKYYPFSSSFSEQEQCLLEYINGWIIDESQTLAVLDLAKIVKKSF